MAVDLTSEQGAFVDRVLMFTDIEDSSRRWDLEPEAMRALMRHHDDLVTSLVAHFGGVVGARTGDGAIALFSTSIDAARSAVEFQRLIALGPAATGVATEPLKIRVGLHRGVVEHRDGEHYGPPMHRAARVMSAGHGGQILITSPVAEELRAHAAARGEPSEFTMVSRGFQRLKGFHEPELLSELRRHDAPTDLRGLRNAVVLGNLPPIDLDTLVGRDAEVAHLTRDLRAGSIVTLLGTGGVGKTRLALQVADLLQDRFGDGVWFVDLAAVGSAERVITELAATIGVPEESTQSLASSLRHAMHSRQMLIVLDNCEHVFDAVSALVRATCSDRMPTAVLATSQRNLGIPGESTVVITPLGCAGPDADEPGHSVAAEMFVRAAERAHNLVPPGPPSWADVERICRRLDGLPLAIELAAARSRVMSVSQIADQLDVSVDLLRSRDGNQRHRTMSAAISWSMDLLSDADRALLVDLSVFNGTFTWEGAAAVSGADPMDVVDSLDELTSRSLLVPRDDGLRMLVPLRLHCRAELATSGREPRVRAAHAQWVRNWIPDPFDDLDPQVAAARVDRVFAATEDIDACHRWYLEHDVAEALAMSLLLIDAHMTRSRFSAALDRFSDFDVDTTPVALRAEAVGWVAAFHWMLGRYELGGTTANRAVAMAKDHGLPLPVMAAILHCATAPPTDILGIARDIEREVRRGDEAQVRAGTARHFSPLGTIVTMAGDPEWGTRLADEGLAESRRIGALLLINTYGNRIMINPGSDEVVAMMPEVIELARAVGRRDTLAQAQVALAHRARRSGDIAGFLAGIVHTAESTLGDYPANVAQMLHWVPRSIIDRFPREAALITAALESWGTVSVYVGADKEKAQRDRLRERLSSILGNHELDRAWSEGAQLGLAQVIDRLHWVADAW